MKTLVLLKQTFDTEEEIILTNEQLNESGVKKFVINPYDEYALEEAISIKEKNGGDVTVVTIGPSRSEEALRSALAIGADRAIIIDDSEITGDEYTISTVLAAIAKQEPYDIIFSGHMTIDDGAAQVGPRVAEQLNIPHISTITKLTVEAGKVIAEKDVEGDLETIEAMTPVLLTAQQGLNEPRYPTLPGIMKAKKKPIERLTLADFNLTAEEVTAKTAVLTQYLPAKKQAGKILEGDIPTQSTLLVSLLRNEAKVV